MNGIADKQLVIMLNKHWKVVGRKNVGDAIVDLCAGVNSKALDIHYKTDENGNPIGYPIEINAVTWEEWIKLPIRKWDFSISSSKMTIRVPTILVAKNYDKMPEKTYNGKPSTDAIFERDGLVDQYDGEKLTRKDASVDHIIPKSRWKELGMKGSPDCWENLATTKKKTNTKKGNKLNSEAGLKLIKKPKKPKPIAMWKLIQEPKHIDHEHFIEKVTS